MFIYTKLNIKPQDTKHRIMQEIELLTRTLIKSFGIKVPVPEKALRILYSQGLYGECLREVMLHFGIPLKIKVICLPGSKTIEEYTGERNAATAAPAKLVTIISSRRSLFWQSDEKIDKATLYIKKDIILLSFEAFMFTASHELSHLFMQNRRHSLASNEKATDILALIMGFRNLARTGRVTTANGRQHIIGYLDNAEFDYALRFIETFIRS